MNERNTGWNLRADGVDQRVIHNSVLVAGAFFNEVAKPSRPSFTVIRHPRKDCVGESGFLKNLYLGAIQFFAAEIQRVDGVRIDENAIDPSTPQHRGRDRACEAATNDS